MDFYSKKDLQKLPEKPECPLDSDCCGNGCMPCVFDLYEAELKIWEAECCRLREGKPALPDANLQTTAAVLKLDKYQGFLIKEISKETEDALRFRCALSLNQCLGLTIGQHLVIRSQTPDGKPLTRQYTPISPVDAKGFFDLVIKIYPTGQMSQLVKEWKIGDMLHARGPIGNFQYSRNKFRRIVMLCAGTGVAPMCQVIGSLLADELEDTYLRLIYACQTYRQLIAKPDLDEWARFWNFSVLYVLSQEPQPPQQDYKYGEEILNGHLTKEQIVIEIGSDFVSTCVLVCGTPSFESDMMKTLHDLGLPDENIHKF